MLRTLTRQEDPAYDPEVIRGSRLWWQDRLPVHEARNEAELESAVVRDSVRVERRRGAEEKRA